MNLITRRFLLRGVATLSVAMWLATIATAQMGGGGSGGGGGGSSGGGGGSMGGGGSSGSSSGGSSLGTTGGGSGSTPGGGAIGAGGAAGGAGGNNSVSQSNFLGPTYSNPLYMGRPNQNYTGTSSGASGTTASASPPGGFGQPSFGATTGTGAQGGLGGLGGSATTSTSGQGSSLSANQSQPTYARLTYTTEVKFPFRRMAPNQLETELRDMVDRSSTLKNPTGIKIQVDGSTVVLGGKAVDEDERRLVEGMIRLTPGVRAVKNEIQVP